MSKATGPGLSVVSRDPHPPLSLRFSLARRIIALLGCALAVAGAVYWGYWIMPHANVQPLIGRTGIAVLLTLVVVSFLILIKRLGTHLHLTEEKLSGKVFRILGFENLDLNLGDMRTIGYVGQGEAPDVLLNLDDGKSVSLPGLLFWDRPEFLEVLRERVARRRAAIAESVEFPATFRPLIFNWVVIIGILFVTVPLAILNLTTQTPDTMDLVIAGSLFLLIPYMALRGMAPFASYTSSGKTITRKAWLRSGPGISVDLKKAHSYFISGGPRRKLHLSDANGVPLAEFEISKYDFSSLIFWAERSLKKSDT